MSTFDIQELVQRIEELELEESQVSQQRRALHQRLAIFPSESQDQAERELSAHRRALHRAIDVARIELAQARLAERPDVRS